MDLRERFKTFVRKSADDAPANKPVPVRPQQAAGSRSTQQTGREPAAGRGQAPAKAPATSAPAASRAGPPSAVTSGAAPKAPARALAVQPSQTSQLPVEASSDQIAFIDTLPSDKVSVLTSIGGKFEATPAQQAYAALLSNGVLVVSRSQIHHHEVSSLRSSLRRKGQIWREFLVDLSVVRSLYERANPVGSAIDGSIDSASMQRTFIKLLGQAAKIGGSDIHITVKRSEALIEIRSDGLLLKVDDMRAAVADELLSAAFAMAAQGETDSVYVKSEFQQSRISEIGMKSLGLRLPDGVQSVRLQFNPLPAGGRYMIARLLYEQKVGQEEDVDGLGYGNQHVAQIRIMRSKPYGINVIAGPTGSGKSTTLQRGITGLIRERPGINVITIEDPPEYVIEGAKQIPVTGAPTAEARSEKFRQAISAALRSDPDVIMIGEIRDGPSAALAFEAAMTGHGVWASLHANNAMAIVDRLRDKKVELYKLCDATLVTGLVGQRLVRRVNAEFAIGWAEALRRQLLPAHIFHFLETHARGLLDNVRFADVEAAGTFRRAYRGRAVVAETILPDQHMLDLLKDDRKPEAVAHWLNAKNGVTMLEHAFVKVIQGQVDPRSLSDVGRLDELDPTRIRDLARLVDLEEKSSDR